MKKGELSSNIMTDSWRSRGGSGGVFIIPINPFRVLHITSWIIQQLTHRTTTRVETDGGDKDSTDNLGEIHSTQQPEDPSEHMKHVSFSRVGLLLFHRFQQHHLSLPDGFVVD